jgi:NAD+ dependent glucose-6-phosphate dehydrogenase
VRVLLTGAAGRIGTAFFAETADRYQFRLADLDVSSLRAVNDHEVVEINIADLDACHAACAGMDAVVHLAADPSPDAEFYPSLLENNVKGVYNIFRAAKDAGCRRVIFASSVHAVVGYPPDKPISTDVAVRPINMYGATKCFGEAVAACFAYGEGLPAIAIRIGAYEAPWLHADPTPANLSAYISPRDLNQLIVRSLEAPTDLRFAVVNGQSNNRIKRFDLTTARELLGYAPQDDAFSLFGVTPENA